MTGIRWESAYFLCTVFRCILLQGDWFRDGPGIQQVVLDLHNRLPVEFRRIPEDVERGFRCGAMENDVEEIITPQALGGFVFV